MSKLKEIGRKYGTLTIKKLAKEIAKMGKSRMWYYPAYLCKCSCGELVTRTLKQLKNGNKMHCGKKECKRFVRELRSGKK